MTATTLQNREGRNMSDVSLRILRNGEWQTLPTDIFAGKSGIVFSLPGAFTPTCASTHLPRHNPIRWPCCRAKAVRSAPRRSRC